MTAQRLALPDVTLVMYEGRTFDLASIAWQDVLEKIDFGGIILFEDHAGLPKELGQAWQWNEMPRDVTTSYILNIEWDSGINDLSQWTDEFLRYDYVGAPWPWHPPHERVGNSGFSLISTRLANYLRIYDYPFIFPYDDTLCRKYRPSLEVKGFKWAPESLARHFSLEWGPLRFSFGYHDCRNWPRILSAVDRSRRLDAADDYALNHPSWKQMLEGGFRS